MALNEKELTDLLVSIENNDIELEEKVDSSVINYGDSDDTELSDDEIKAIQEQESIDIEKLNDHAWGGISIRNKKFSTVCYVTQEEMHDLWKQKINAYNSWRKERRQAIIKNAFIQTEINLTDQMTDEHKQLLYKGLSERYTKNIAYISATLAKQSTNMLKPFVPKDLARCYKKYPDTVIRHQGFMYKCTEKYGQSLEFWVVPNVPNCFSHGAEMQLIDTLPMFVRYKIDKNIVSYYDSKKRLAKLQISLASKFARYKRITFYRLLKDSPFYFECVYNQITNKKLVELPCDK